MKLLFWMIPQLMTEKARAPGGDQTWHLSIAICGKQPDH